MNVADSRMTPRRVHFCIAVFCLLCLGSQLPIACWAMDGNYAHVQTYVSASAAGFWGFALAAHLGLAPFGVVGWGVGGGRGGPFGRVRGPWLAGGLVLWSACCGLVGACGFGCPLGFGSWGPGPVLGARGRSPLGDVGYFGACVARYACLGMTNC